MMTSDTSCQAHDYSSSELTAVSARCEGTLELGRKLTRELGLDQSVDTLGRWMAHYVAELIQDAEKANIEERPAKMRAYSEAILSLWKHRYELANGKSPFAELEPILRALQSLDPDDKTPRYFRSARFNVDEAEANDETKSWLKLIDGLDYSARMLIRYFLTKTAQTALDKSAKWVALAETAGADNDAEAATIRVIVDEDCMLKTLDPDEEARKCLEHRIDRLEEFAKMAMALASELRQQVAKTESAIAES